METPLRAEQGFSLVEVVLALGIATFALIAIIGLLPMAMKSNRDTAEETRAVTVLESMIADRQTSPAAAPSVVYGLPVLTNSAPVEIFVREDGGVTEGASEARYRIKATAYQPTGFRQPTYLHLSASWPAGSASPTAFVEMTAAFAP